MLKRLLALLLLCLPAAAAASPAPQWSIVIHGGAGVIERGRMSVEREAEYRRALAQALEAGAARLRAGASSLDAVEAAIRVMEDDPLFNAGKGAVFTAAGRNELDAAIMDGQTRRAGAVAGVRTVKNPISLARRVMEQSPHVMLAGRGAEQFAEEQGFERMPRAYFFTERRWDSLRRALRRENLPIPNRPKGAPERVEEEADADASKGAALEDLEHRFGTVGVVAIDRSGRIAVGSSTGGTTAKRWGRVGDTPVIGAGLYAEKGCAVAATGTGEYFIRLSVARTICAMKSMREMSLQRAADRVIQRELSDIGGDGGVIAMDSKGRAVWSFNTPGMYRAKLAAGGAPVIAIYADEP